MHRKAIRTAVLNENVDLHWIASSHQGQDGKGHQNEVRPLSSFVFCHPATSRLEQESCYLVRIENQLES
jgi:hypothetical protein